MSDEFDEDEMDEMSEDFNEEEVEADAKSLLEEIFDEAGLGEPLSELDVLTLEDAADYLKVDYGTVRRLIKEQGLPGRKIGDEWRFLRGAIADWLRNPAPQQQQPREEFRPPQRRHEEASESEAPRFQRGSRYPQSNQGSRYPQEGRPPRKPRYPDNAEQEGRFPARGGQGNYPPPRRQCGGGHGNQQQFDQNEYRPPRRNQFGGNEQGQGGFGGQQQGGRKFAGGPKKPKRKALNEQRFKRLDRRKFGEHNEGQFDSE
jgi:excisionase family DNA binding protein